MLLVTTSAGSTLSRAVCQSPARSFSLSCTTPHLTPENSLWGLHLWHGHNPKNSRHFLPPHLEKGTKGEVCREASGGRGGK